MKKLIKRGIDFIDLQTNESPIFKTLVFKIFKKMTSAHLTINTLYDQKKYTFGENGYKGVKAEINVHCPSFFKRVALYTDLGLAESYIDKIWDTPSLRHVILFFIHNLENSEVISGSDGNLNIPFKLMNIGSRIGHVLRDNTLKNSRKNIEEHYDLSNDLYEKFLDYSMTYSCALFNGKEKTLEQAQYDKYERLCQQLKLNSDDYLLEIGSGWGGLSIYAAKKYGVKIKTITISQEQFEYAKNKINKEGLSELIDIEILDYRLLPERYPETFTKAISIEMVEAVGDQFMNTYARSIGKCLKKNGLFAIQAITSPNSRYEEIRQGVDFIQKHIFPGSLLPSLQKLTNSFAEQAQFDMINLKDMGLDYAKTLRMWQVSFNENIEKITALGFNQEFKRKWNYYFSYCEAAFSSRNISVVQILFSKPNNNVLSEDFNLTL